MFESETLSGLIVRANALSNAIRNNTDRNTVHDDRLRLLNAEIDRREGELSAFSESEYEQTHWRDGSPNGRNERTLPARLR